MEAADPNTPAVRDSSWRSNQARDGRSYFSHWVEWSDDDTATLSDVMTPTVERTLDELIRTWSFMWPDVGATTLPARHADWCEKLAKVAVGRVETAHMYFSREERWVETALHVGLHEHMRRIRTWPHPAAMLCAVCGRTFAPETLSHWMRRYGPPRYCTACCCRSLNGHTLEFPHELARKSLVALSEALGFVPPQAIRGGQSVGEIVEQERRDRVMACLIALPTTGALAKSLRVTPGRGPWLRILVASQLIDDGWRPSRGVFCLASDGHACRSLGERAVDDWLSRHGVGHEVEPHWPFHEGLNPTGKLRADWRLPDGTLVEYAGMMEDPAYKRKMAMKSQLAQTVGVRLIVVTPNDLVALDQLFAEYA
jgi:hypothetical protein